MSKKSKYILCAAALLILLHAQVFFYPLAFRWYSETYFDGKDTGGTTAMAMLMCLTGFGTLGGILAAAIELIHMKKEETN